MDEIHVCACGCGGVPKNKKSKYCWGHHIRILKVSQRPDVAAKISATKKGRPQPWCAGDNYWRIRRYGRRVPQLCNCGCGALAKLGRRFIKGHQQRTSENRLKASIRRKGRPAPWMIGDKNPSHRPEIKAVKSLKMLGDKNPAKRFDVRAKLSANNPMHKYEYRRKVSDIKKAHRTECNFYIDGLGKERANHRIREMETVDYNTWRRSVFFRDKYKCVICGSNHNIQAHHIKSWRAHPELRYDVSNGRTLCKECHRKTDNYGGRFRRALPEVKTFVQTESEKNQKLDNVSEEKLINQKVEEE